MELFSFLLIYPFLNRIFLTLYLIFEKLGWFIYNFSFHLLYRFILENKKCLFWFMQPCMIYFFSFLCYLINLIYASISIIVWLNKKIILINKFSKHNRIYVLSYEIKYPDLYLSIDFSNLFLIIVNDFFIIINTHNSRFI